MSTGPRDDSSEILLPALITRTSSELLGRRPVPRVLKERPTVFVLGPPGVGKTTVARRLLGETSSFIEADFRKMVIAAARDRTWAKELRESDGLLFDDVDFLTNRFGAQGLLGRLLRERAVAGRRTLLCQGGPDDSVTTLYSSVPFPLRATLLLRFPVGRGRRRHVVSRCEARGIPYDLARAATAFEPWSYDRVEDHLDGLPKG